MKNKSKTRRSFLTPLIFTVFLLAALPAVAVKAAEPEEVTAALLEKYSALDMVSVDASTGMASGTFAAEAGNTASVGTATHKIIIPEDGYYRISYSGIFRGDEGIVRDWDNNSMKFTLCANETCTKPVLETECIGLGDEILDCFTELSKGTYYLLAEPCVNNDEKSVDITYGVSFGYLPKDTEFISVEKEADPAAKTVTLTVNGKDASDIRIKPGKNQDLSGILWEDADTIGDGEAYTITEGSEDGWFTIRMVDKYSNVYGKSVQITEFDKPSVPEVKTYKSGTKKVSGTAVAGGVVSVKVSGKIYPVTADNSGAWSVQTALLKAGVKVEVSVTSTFGVSSDTAVLTVKNISFAKPKITKAKKNTKKVVGKAKANTTVYVKIGKKTYSAKAGASGKFTVKTAKLKKKTKLKVYAKDAAGNTSKKTSYTVK